jgi:asparagine synthase (glutamine-hydrolysing)
LRAAPAWRFSCSPSGTTPAVSFSARGTISVSSRCSTLTDGNAVVVSNALDCVRLHPAISHELHEPAIADFLLFGVNQDNGTTSFRDIRRLPPAHRIRWSPDGCRCQRYWTLPIEEPMQLRRAGEYPERLRALLSDAVRDRLRTRRVVVLMSGGGSTRRHWAATSLRVLRETALAVLSAGNHLCIRPPDT